MFVDDLEKRLNQAEAMTAMDGSSITLSTWLGQHNMLTTLIGIVGLFVYIFLNLLEKSIDYKSLRLPPGPQGWPVVGNLLQLGKLPHQALTDLSKQYGSLMFLQLGSVPTIVVSSAEMAEEVFSTQDHLFASSRPRTLTGEILHYNNRGLILAPLRDQWRFVRRVASSNLFPVKRLEQFQVSPPPPPPPLSRRSSICRSLICTCASLSPQYPFPPPPPPLPLAILRPYSDTHSSLARSRARSTAGAVSSSSSSSVSFSLSGTQRRSCSLAARQGAIG